MSGTAPTLVIMAAGVGRRFGGDKQVAEVGPAGEAICDYTIHDARQAGFGRVVLVVRRSIERALLEHVRAHFPTLDVVTVCQDEHGPARAKPWGTGQAVLVAAPHVPGPFAVANADDLYGRESFELLAEALRQPGDADRPAWFLVGFRVGHTLSEHGPVARGRCLVDEQDRLVSIEEWTHVRRADGGIVADQGRLRDDDVVSMNLWGFTTPLFAELETRFQSFVERTDPAVRETAELMLPEVIADLIAQDTVDVTVLRTPSPWLGVTYAEDVPAMRDELQRLVDTGVYPARIGPTVPPIVAADWVADHLDEIVVADVRWYLDGRSGRDAHEAGHVPGAVFADLDRLLAAPGSPAAGRHPLPAPDDFAAGLGALGIGEDRTVVAYDDAGGTTAARLVWLLRVLGQPAALLDGGIGAWTSSGRDLDTGPVEPTPTSRAPRPWPPDRLAGIDEAATAAAGGIVLLDARAAARFRGEVEPIDPRAGHVPGARSVPTTELLDPATGRFLAPSDLRARFATAGVTEGVEVIASCGSGVTACHLLIGLEIAGLGPGRLWPGSFSQWSNDPARSVASGPD